MNLKDAHSVFLIETNNKKNNKNTADQRNEKGQILAVVQIIKCRQERDIHPEHLVNFKPPLMHVDRIDTGKQNGQIIQKIEKRTRRE